MDDNAFSPMIGGAFSLLHRPGLHLSSRISPACGILFIYLRIFCVSVSTDVLGSFLLPVHFSKKPRLLLLENSIRNNVKVKYEYICGVGSLT